VIDERDLEQAERVFVPPEKSFDRFLRRRDQKRRNRRIAAGVVGIAVFVAAVWIVTTGGSINRTRQPAIKPMPRPTAIPAYHHNGEILVFKDGAFTQIDPVTANVVTGNGVELPVAHPVSDFAWSPDGMDLAYATNGRVQVVDVATGASREIMSRAGHCSLAWSPEGASMAVAHDGMLELIDPEGGNRSTLVKLPGIIVQPTWSPDGERIAFQVVSDERSLYVIDRDGSNLSDLLGPAPQDSIGFFDPAWSPDGTRIAYIASTHAGSTQAGPWRLRVEVVDADGSNPTELVEAGTCYCLGFTPGLTWSPDGASMALIVPGQGPFTGSLDEGAYGLYVMNADGTGLRLVAKGVDGTPAWRPAP
jgi:dipeptidyl aminopeptidase/acylaminoacyl peptidase